MHASVMREISWKVDGKPDSSIFYRPIGPLSIAKIQRAKNIDPERLSHFRKSHHTFTTYVEPFYNHSYTLGLPTEPFAHSKTSLLDLSLSESALLSSFSQKTRYNVNRNLRHNQLKIISSPLSSPSTQLLNDFYTLHHDWSSRKKLIGYPLSLLKAVFKSFHNSGTLHLAYDNKIPVGALLILYNDRVATYYAAFATTHGFALFAPTLLTWQSLLTAKEDGCDIYDFGGVYDPRYPRMYKNWEGFTKFKAGFHPTELIYPETRLHLFW